MSQALANLIELLTLEPLGKGVFQGQNEDLGWPQVFGGHVVAQSLAAAMAVVEPDRTLHSCHSYFLRPGDTQFPIIYETEILREGRSFSTVAVRAKQNGNLIYQVMSSFHTEEESFEHQVAMPDLPDVAQSVSENAWIKATAEKWSEPLKSKWSQERAFEVQLQYPYDLFKGEKLPPNQTIWLKLNGSAELTPQQQQCLMAYFSDYHCTLTMLQPHEEGIWHPSLRIVSLDHSIWFHRPIEVAEGVIFRLDSPIASAGRGLTRGQVFTPNGQLLMSYQQEGLLRKLTP
ncbi:hypothetical protein A4G19_00840 [Pasteurellaceae bacterium Macca]|nr:hypothetical protein [Pasteurellaceae bacterium Macca]